MDQQDDVLLTDDMLTDEDLSVDALLNRLDEVAIDSDDERALLRRLAIELNKGPPAPCATCVLADTQCKPHQLACKRYRYYYEVEAPRGFQKKAEWARKVYINRDNGDFPTRAIYDEIFESEGKTRLGRRPKLSAVEVEAIQYQLSRGVSDCVLADEFLVDTKVIGRIKQGERAVLS